MIRKQVIFQKICKRGFILELLERQNQTTLTLMLKTTKNNGSDNVY